MRGNGRISSRDCRQTQLTIPQAATKLGPMLLSINDLSVFVWKVTVLAVAKTE
jgi:hypothetical protein